MYHSCWDRIFFDLWCPLAWHQSSEKIQAKNQLSNITFIKFWWIRSIICNYLRVFLGILTSKQMVQAFLFSFSLRNLRRGKYNFSTNGSFKKAVRVKVTSGLISLLRLNSGDPKHKTPWKSSWNIFHKKLMEVMLDNKP